jgi:hypothetical protein
MDQILRVRTRTTFPPEKHDVSIGDIVRITTGKGLHSMVAIRGSWRVTAMFHYQPGDPLSRRGRSRKEPAENTVCLELSQDGFGNAYEPGGMCREWFTTTWDEYLALRRGDHAELCALGVLSKPSIFMRLKWWWAGSPSMFGKW